MKKFLALTIVLVVVAGLGAAAAKPVQTHPEEVSLGVRMERNTLQSVGVFATVPMFDGNTQFYWGSGIATKDYAFYHRKDSIYSASAIFYPNGLSVKTNLKDTFLPDILKLEDDYYQATIGLGPKFLLRGTSKGLALWEYDKFHAGGYLMVSAKATVPLDVTNVKMLKKWDVSLGYEQSLLGVITEEPFVDAQAALKLEFDYDF